MPRPRLLRRPPLAAARRRLSVLALALLLTACGKPADVGSRGDDAAPDGLVEVAAFDTTQITGVAVAGARLFVNAPHWGTRPAAAVMEVLEDGTTRPYPDATWNAQAGSPRQRFVCVQSVYVDPRNPGTLWILDPASPGFQGVVPGGAKLVAVDLATDTVVRTIAFDARTAPTGSYLNDVRVDAAQATAYLTDSNLGALVVVDLATGEARRVLDAHPSTAPDTSYVLRPGGRPLDGPDGTPVRIASDGLALSPDDAFLYYHALTGTHLYRVPTAALAATAAAPATLGAGVEDLGPTVATDGMIMDAKGRLYHSAIERDAVVRRLPDGRLETVVEDARLKWPDSFALAADDMLYVTTSQIHLMPQYNDGQSLRTEPYRVFRLDPDVETSARP